MCLKKPIDTFNRQHHNIFKRNLFHFTYNKGAFFPFIFNLKKNTKRELREKNNMRIFINKQGGRVITLA